MKTINDLRRELRQELNRIAPGINWGEAWYTCKGSDKFKYHPQVIVRIPLSQPKPTKAIRDRIRALIERYFARVKSAGFAKIVALDTDRAWEVAYRLDLPEIK